MSRPRSPQSRVRSPVAPLLVAACALAGCAGEGPVSAPVATNPPNPGAVCADRTGDLSRVAGELGGSLGEPAGADLIHAEARVTPTTLQVSFATAAPVTEAPSPELRLGQGLPGQLDSFELIAAPAEGGDWVLRLVTFRTDPRGGVGEAPRAVLAVPVSVEGTTVSFEVPLRDLPPITSYVWQFGSSSTVGPGADDTVIDVCDDHGGAGSTAPATSGDG